MPDLSEDSEVGSHPIPFELASLAGAVRYQRWLRDLVAPDLGRRILEVGAGIGNMSRWLPVRDLLVLSEVDAALVPLLRDEVAATFGDDPRVHVGSIDLAADVADVLDPYHLDTIVSFNVLEHIADDGAAVAGMWDVLERSPAPRPHRLVSLVPAHQWAYGGFDAAFDHHRRYSRKALLRLGHEAAPGARVSVRHLNLSGLAGWWLLGRVLRRDTIDRRSVQLNERILPVVRPVDDAIHERLRLPLGQSAICVIER